MKILLLHDEIREYLKKRGLEEKFKKQKIFFEENVFHRSLNTELLEPKRMRIWSFRLDHKYRAIFIFKKKDIVEVIDINDHYQ
jgi:plasmid maintenance system killer protein